MIEMYHAAGKSGSPVRWLTRVLSMVTSVVFLIILFLAVTDEDVPHGAANPVLVVLALTIVATMAAWRWEKAGGLAVVLLALCLSKAVYSSSPAFGLSSLRFIPAVIYGVPFLVVGILFWVCGQTATSSSRQNLGPSC